MKNVQLSESFPCSLFTARGTNGFTLIEIIIVLFIFVIVSGITGIYIHHRSSDLELKTFTKEMSATLRYARSSAIAEKKIYSFFIWKDKGAYGLYSDYSAADDMDESVPAVYRPFPELLKTVFEDRSDYQRIDFSPQGNSSGGMITIKNQKGSTFYILINRITGRVQIKKSEN